MGSARVYSVLVGNRLLLHFMVKCYRILRFAVVVDGLSRIIRRWKSTMNRHARFAPDSLAETGFQISIRYIFHLFFFALSFFFFSQTGWRKPTRNFQPDDHFQHPFLSIETFNGSHTVKIKRMIIYVLCNFQKEIIF